MVTRWDYATGHETAFYMRSLLSRSGAIDDLIHGKTKHNKTQHRKGFRQNEEAEVYDLKTEWDKTPKIANCNGDKQSPEPVTN